MKQTETRNHTHNIFQVANKQQGGQIKALEPFRETTGIRKMKKGRQKEDKIRQEETKQIEANEANGSKWRCWNRPLRDRIKLCGRSVEDGGTWWNYSFKRRTPTVPSSGETCLRIVPLRSFEYCTYKSEEPHALLQFFEIWKTCLHRWSHPTSSR